MTELEALAHWLPIHGLALAAGARLERLGGGIANRNEGVMLASGPTTFRAVLRRPPPGPLAAGASDMAREARVLAALAPHFPLAPRLIAFCADEAVLGTQFQLIERRDGAAIAGTLPPASGDGLALVETTLQAMAALHALDPVTLGLGDLGKPKGFYARQLKGWTARAEAVWPDGLPAAVATLIAGLTAAVPPETFSTTPNPFSSALTLSFDARFSATGQLRITDMLGRTVAAQAVAVRAGNNSMPLALSGIAPGIYLLTLRIGESQVVTRIAKE